MIKYETENGILFNEDCFNILPEIPDQSVDMILCDLPFGTTPNHWDIPLPLEDLFAHYDRIIKDNGAIVLFSQLPFSVDLINTYRKNFRYEWIWEKPNAVGFLNANRMPLRAHENILVFYKKLPVYNPQKRKGQPYSRPVHGKSSNYGKCERLATVSDGMRYPRDVITFSKEMKYHPTAKPVSLCEYLIETYTNPNALVLDNCMGSGSVPVAASTTGRRFIGVEKESVYFKTAISRLKDLENHSKLVKP